MRAGQGFFSFYIPGNSTSAFHMRMEASDPGSYIFLGLHQRRIDRRFVGSGKGYFGFVAAG